MPDSLPTGPQYDQARSLRTGVISPDRRLLVLAPHPDDFDAIGVTLKFFFDRGNPLFVGVVPTGSGIEDAYRPGLTLAGKTRLRKREQRNSLRFFGLPEDSLMFLNLERDDEDQALDHPANRDALKALVNTQRPDVVFLPHGNDTNSGHRAIYSLFSQVASDLESPLLALLNRDPKTITLRADLYMPFSLEEAAWKSKLLRFHDSQHQRNLNARGQGFDERILSLNRQISRDLAIEEPYAELFEAQVLHGRSGS